MGQPSRFMLPGFTIPDFNITNASPAGPCRYEGEALTPKDAEPTLPPAACLLSAPTVESKPDHVEPDRPLEASGSVLRLEEELRIERSAREHLEERLKALERTLGIEDDQKWAEGVCAAEGVKTTTLVYWL